VSPQFIPEQPPGEIKLAEWKGSKKKAGKKKVLNWPQELNPEDWVPSQFPKEAIRMQDQNFTGIFGRFYA